MKITFLRGLIIDLDNVPEDFDEIIRNIFKDYTNGTASDYRYQDKLAFIDRCTELLHKAENEHEAVKGLILKKTESQLDEYRELPDAGDFNSIEFMEDCYRKGMNDMRLYSYYTGDRHKDDKIMKLLERVIMVVITYGGE